MKRKTLSTTVDVDVDYQIRFEDLLEIIESCNEKELNEIRDLITDESNSGFKVSTLYDEHKLKVLKVAFKKYDIDELMKRLDITYNEY